MAHMLQPGRNAIASPRMAQRAGRRMLRAAQTKAAARHLVLAAAAQYRAGLQRRSERLG